MFNLWAKETAKLALMTALDLRLKNLLQVAGFKDHGFIFDQENHPYDRAVVQPQLVERLDRLEGMLLRLTPADLIRADAGLADAPAEDNVAMSQIFVSVYSRKE